MKKFFVYFSFQLLHFTYLSQNNALSFDGANDDVTVAYDSNIDFSVNDVFSIEVWFKTGNGTAVIFSNHVDTPPFVGFEVAIVNGKAVFEMINNYLSNALRIETVASYNDNNWHHLAVVYYGNPNATTVKFYIDGILQSMNVTDNSLSASASTNNAPHIGSRNSTTYFFGGGLEELRIWNRALCQDEIVWRKNCQLIGNESGLIGYYNFNQGTAGGVNMSVTNLPDLGTGNNPGTLNGFNLSGSTSNWVTSTAPVSGTCGLFSPLTVSGPATICPGNSAVMNVTGAATYTWLPGIQTGSQVTHTATTSITYTVNGTTTNGCIVSAIRTQSVLPVTSLTLTGPTALCPGNPAVMNVSGATSYTWQPGAFTGSQLTHTATTSITYTVTGTTSGGCLASAIRTQSVLTITPLTITGPSAVCPGKSAVMDVSGAANYTWQPGAITGSQVTHTATTSITYTVTGTDSNGCIASSIRTQSVLTVSSLTVTGPASVCKGNSAVMNATGATNYTWQPGTLTGSQVIHTATSSITYTITGTNSNGCEVSAIRTQSVSPCTGLSENSFFAKTNIYPNPASEFLFVSNLPDNCKVKIYNALGALLIEQESSGDIELPLKDLAGGFYLIKIQSNTNQVVRRFLKQ